MNDRHASDICSKLRGEVAGRFDTPASAADLIETLARELDTANAANRALRKAAHAPRCPECCGELSACGEMTVDGPSDDCVVCQLRAEMRRLVESLKEMGMSPEWIQSARMGTLAEDEV